MSINLNSLISLQASALDLRARRHELIATNIANADTPGYKARDIDFKSALDQTMRAYQAPEAPGASRLLQSGPDVQYRNPWQPSQDGNTVESQIEQAALAENAIQYQATLNFLRGKFSDLKLALTGNSSGG